MGIEPTEQHSSMRPTGFEDQGRHQPSIAYRCCRFVPRPPARRAF